MESLVNKEVLFDVIFSHKWAKFVASNVTILD
jgi:hypothetical protein